MTTSLQQAHRTAVASANAAEKAAGADPKRRARAYLRAYQRSLLEYAYTTNPVKAKP